MQTTTEERQRLEEIAQGRPSSVPSWVSMSIVTLGVGWMAVRAAAPITELDTWWHLRLGDEFRSGWALSDPGQLTPFATEDWVPTQWLLEVVGSYLVDWFGVAAISWLTGIGVVLVGLVLFLICRREASALPATVAVLAALGGISATVSPRPQIATYVFLAVFVGAWLKTARDLRPRWWLVPLTWLWACTHGMWFVGTALGFVVVLGLALDRGAPRGLLLKLAAVPAAGAAAAALTPVGPGLLLAPFRVSGISGFITEWAPPNFREPYAMLTALLLAVVVLSWARSGPVSWVRALLLMQALGWTLLSARTVALGAILVAPLLAGVMAAWLQERRDPARARRDMRAAGLLALVAALAVTVSMQFKAPTTSPVGARIDAALAEAPAGSVVINEYGFGGWLDWRHRELVPVVDGLTESFSVEHLAAHSDTLYMAPGW